VTDRHEVENEVGRTLADRLLGEAGTAALGHLALLGIVMALVWRALPTGVAAAWATAVLGATVGRLLLWRRARTLQLAPATAAATARTTMTALGLAWGLGTAVAAQYLPPFTVVLVVMGLAGLLAGAVASLVADRWAFKLYLGAMFGPALAGVLFAGNQPPEDATLVLILVFAGFMWREHERAYRTLVEGLRTEQRLRERERQLAAAQAIAHVGSWEWRIPTNRVTWSDELCRMYGQSPGSPASYEGFVRLVHPDDRERVERTIAQGLAERRTVEYEWRLVQPSGNVRHIHGINVVILDGAGTPIGLAGTSYDITERKLAEENQQTLLRELQAAVTEVKTLQGWIRICANCKRVLNDAGVWEQFEAYVHAHAGVDFSHGICPECATKWAANL
jgi:PAS domain S-box-containing protein